MRRKHNTTRRNKGELVQSPPSIRSQNAQHRTLHVLSAMRRNPKLPLARAAKLEGVKPDTVKQHAKGALEKHNGKFRVKNTDRFSVTLYVPDRDGNPVPVHTRSSKERQQLSEYLRDVGRYLGGKRDALAPWHGTKVAGVELVTAGRVIESIEPALSDFSLYRTFNGGER